MGEEHGQQGQLDLCPERVPRPPPHPRARGGLPAPITQLGNPTTSLGGRVGLSPSSYPSSPQESKEPKEEQEKDLTPRVINYLLTN